MAKQKKAPKAKEPIKVRFKNLANGNQSIYLDSYKDGRRVYEFLKLYLIPEVDAAARIQNANTLQAANAIKAQRMIELANAKAGLKVNPSRSKMLLFDWLMKYKASQDNKQKHTAISMPQLAKVLRSYGGDKVQMKDIDTAFCLGFINYLRNAYRTALGERLKAVTMHNYCRCFTCALNAAVRADVIPENPFMKIASVDKIKVPESPREYLTMEEIQMLIDADAPNNLVKQAYLFSVFCGLRISDIEALTWKQVVSDGEKIHLEIVMQKTKEPLYLPLSPDAQKWMPERRDKTEADRVFDLPHPNSVNKLLKQWVRNTNITKNVTFHTARHTFATMMLTLGADLYTTSKLLGHKDVATTQIYAKIVNKKKDEAVNLVNGIFQYKASSDNGNPENL